MKPLDPAKNELKKAKNYIEVMKVSKSLDKFEDNWKNYLHKIERTWNKACHQLERSPKFQGWPRRGKVIDLRKKDELLSYLINSRGADEHTINGITKRESGGVGINPTTGYIDKMEITQKDDKLTINTNSPIHVTFFPEKVVLVDVVNRGRTYSVPLKHLGKKLKNASPIDIAERGYEFYEKFINEAEEYFCKQSIV